MDRVITDVKQVTPEWLTNVLETHGQPDHRRVTTVEVKSSRQTIISNTYHLEIKCSDPAAQAIRLNLFLKLSKPDFDARITARFGKRESLFYNVIAKKHGPATEPDLLRRIFA